MPSSADQVMMDDEEVTSSWTAIIVAILSLIGYWLFLKPTAAGGNNANASNNTRPTRQAPQATPRQQQQQQRQQQPPQVAEPRRNPPSAHLSDAALELLLDCQSKPTFVKTEAETLGIGGHKALVDGLVAFSHTRASASSSDHRTERAKILSRLLVAVTPAMSAVAPPPGKGSTLVVSLPPVDQHHDKNGNVPQILHILGSYFTLIVIGSTPNDTATTTNMSSLIKEQEKHRTKLQKTLFAADSSSSSSLSLTELILPKHRILMASTKTGRIALVRQLVRVELVVDYDADVQTELGRFGYKVAVIPNLSNLLDE